MMWKWYVYRLVDPRDGQQFYIGKGSGKRIEQHEREAARGVCSKKTQRIKEITDAGGEVGKEIVAHFCNERSALEYERALIAEIGLERLTNIAPGGTLGRRSGTPNRLTLMLARLWEMVVAKDIQGAERFLDDVAEHDPETACELFLRLLKRAFPRVKNAGA